MAKIKEHTMEIKEPLSSKVLISLPQSLFDRTRKFSKSKNKSFNEITRIALNELLEKYNDN